MLDQSFSVKNVLRITTRNEIIKFKLGREESDYKKSLESVSEKLISADFDFNKIKSIKIRNKKTYSTECPVLHYGYKKVSLDLKRLYKIAVKNRDEISDQVFRILENSGPFSVIRLDIKSFYESINFSEVINKLESDKLLSHQSLSLLKNTNSFFSEAGFEGLPRGLSISPVLSEIITRNLDKELKSLSEVYYYARYVDDIIIISFSNYDTFYSKVIEVIEKFSLSVNKKTEKMDINTVNERSRAQVLTYLGYRYEITNKKYNLKRVVNVLLSKDKLNKIKTRLIHSFIDYYHNRNETLLLERLRILSGNYPIYSGMKSSGLKAGVYYSNRLVNKKGSFKELDHFLKNCLRTKKENFFGRCIGVITPGLKSELININFVEGFSSRVFYNISSERMLLLKSCWKHQNHRKK